MKDTIVIDLDGTLANIDHRLHLVQGKKKDFDKFYKLVGGDTPNDWCRRMMNVFWQTGYEVAIVSARRESCRADTIRWLNDHHINSSALYLVRPDGDSTPDQELKMAWLKEYGAENILFVVDDRQKVVDSWRAAGVTCLQAYAWEESKGKTA